MLFLLPQKPQIARGDGRGKAWEGGGQIFNNWNI